MENKWIALERKIIRDIMNIRRCDLSEAQSISEQVGLYNMLNKLEYPGHYDSEEWAEAVLNNYQGQ